MATFIRCVFLASLVVLVGITWADVTKPLRKFEYKYSFKGPHLTQKDGSVPFWQFGGSKYELLNSCFNDYATLRLS